MLILFENIISNPQGETIFHILYEVRIVRLMYDFVNVCIGIYWLFY